MEAIRFVIMLDCIYFPLIAILKLLSSNFIKTIFLTPLQKSSKLPKCKLNN